MSTDSTPGFRPGPDDISAPGAGSPGVPLSIEALSLLTNIEATVAAHDAAVASAVSDTLNQAYDELNGSQSDMGVTLSAIVGDLDNQITDHEYATGKPLDKIVTQHLVDIVGHENQLSIAGVHVGGTTDEIAALTVSDSPENMVARLAGIDPLSDAPPAGAAASLAAGGGGDVAPNTTATTACPPWPDGSPGCAPGIPAGNVGPPPDSPPPSSPPVPLPEPPPLPPVPPASPPPRDIWVMCPGDVAPHVWHPGDPPLRSDCRIVPAPEPPPTPPPPPEPPPPPWPSCPPPPPCGCHEPEPSSPPPSSPPPPEEPPPTPPPPPEEPPPETCRVPEPVHACVPDSRPATLPCTVWCAPNILIDVQERLDRIVYDAAGDPNVPTEVPLEERTIFGSLWAGITYPSRSMYTALEWIGSGFDSEVADEAKKEVGRTLSLEGLGAEALRTIISGPFKDCIRDLPAVMRLGSQVAAAVTAESKTGFPAQYLVQQSMYLYQYANPQYIPSQDSIDREFLMGIISDADWEALTRANGNLPDCFRKSRDSKQLKPNAGEVMSLYLRGELNEAELVRRYTELGVVDPKYTVEFGKLARFVPPYTDITSFMVRDTFDDEVVKKYDLDKDFDKKFVGQASKWANAQGIDADVFRQIWRAHWKIPSNTQLYDMVNRLRPGRREVRDWEQQWLDPVTGAPLPDAPPKPPTVTLDDIRQALLVNDNAPYWVEALLRINTHPINRTDAINAYHANAFTEDELFEALRDNNYSAVDAQRVVDIQKTVRGRRFANLTGTWTFRQIVAAYKAGTIDGQRADALLTPLMPDAAQRQDILVKANDQVSADVVGQWLKRARRAYFVGEWTKDETRKELLDRKVDPQRVEQLMEKWTAEQTGRFREPAVEMLRKWYVIGTITQDDLYGRLLRLGFNDIDARRIVAQAQDDSVQRQRKDFKYTRTEYQAAYNNLKQARKADPDMLVARIEELKALERKVQAELVRLERVFAENAP